jgi:hypothetical protein
MSDNHNEVQPFEYWARRVERRGTECFPIFSQHTDFQPGMPEHMENLLGACFQSKNPRCKAQAFLYIMWGVKVLELKATSPEAPFAFETPTDEDAKALEKELAEMRWDCNQVHSFLFDTPRKFSCEQAWALADALLHSLSGVNERRLAFAMGTVPRLGKNSPVNDLQADVLQAILTRFGI